jgi:hypothetical protein
LVVSESIGEYQTTLGVTKTSPRYHQHISHQVWCDLQ